MSIESELNCIELELKLIKESQERITTYKEELNKHNPFNIGDKLEGNDTYNHNGKTFIASNTSVSHQSSSIFRGYRFASPKYFVASGRNVKKNGELGAQSVQRSVKIKDVITQG